MTDAHRTSDQRLLQIRRSHASARPNPTANPAWFHTHNDLTYVLSLLDERLTVTSHNDSLPTPNRRQP